MTVAIPLGRPGPNRAYVIVDDEDAPMLKRWKWQAHRHPSGTYARRKVNIDGGPKYRQVWMHREILGLPRWPIGDLVGDHINGNPLDNRRVNLRITTRKRNLQHRTTVRASISGRRNVYWMASTQRWRVKVRVDQRQHHLGYFDDLDEAERVAAAFRAEHLPPAA